MSLLWADLPNNDPGLYSTTTSLMDDGIYAQINGNMVPDPDPTAPMGTVFQMFNSQASSGILRYIFSNGSVEFAGVAARYYLANIPSTDTLDNPALVQFRDVSNTTSFSLVVTAAARLKLVNGYVGGSTIAETTGPVMLANAWQHIEVWAHKGGAGTGSIEVRLEGVTVITATGLTLGGTGDWAQVAHQFAGSNVAGGSFYIKTNIYLDGQGSENNDFIGTCGVFDRVTNSDIDFTGWGTSVGSTGWNLIDESPANDADYISAPFPLPSPAVFGLTNLPANITSVKSILPIARMQKTDGGDAQIQLGLVNSGAGIDAEGTDRAITTAMVYWYDSIELNPLTSAPWIPSTADTLDLQITRTV